jgi:ParB/RepB/Spo0J family partition protein
MKVVEYPLEKILIENRAREDMGNIDELAESFKEKGILQPITVSKRGRLLAGGRRVAAAKKAGLTSIPAVVREGDELDAMEIELFENIHRKDFAWSERAALEKRIFDVKTKKDPGWTQRDQAHLLDVSVGSVNRRIQLAEYLTAIPELSSCRTEEDAWKTVKKIEESYVVDALTKQAEARNRGEQEPKVAKWAENHYKVGDALDGLSRLNKGIFHFAEVDPPYGIDLKGRKSRGKTVGVTDQYNEVEGSGYGEFLRACAQPVFDTLYENAFCVWWFGQEWYTTVLAVLLDVGFKVNPIPAIWYKGNAGQTASPDTMLGSSYETFFVARKGQPKLARAGRSNVFHYSPVPPKQKIHPTEKPMDLMLDIMETFLFPGSRVLCPFLGSGVTLRAAYRGNHLGLGWDLSVEYKKRFLTAVKQDELLGIKPKVEKAVGE